MTTVHTDDSTNAGPFVPPDDLGGTPEQRAWKDALKDAYGQALTSPIADTAAMLANAARALQEAQAPANPAIPIADLLGGVLDDIATRYETRQRTGLDVMGHSIGFPRMDKMMGGLEPGRISIMLAAPGAGKTTFSNQMAYTLAANGVPVLYVSFENDPRNLTLKQVARIAEKNIGDVWRGSVDPASLQHAYATLQRTAGARLFYMQGTAAISVDALLQALQRVQETAPGVPPVIIIDYLQQMARAGNHWAGEDIRNRVGTISRQLTDLAKSANAHVWAISSVSRGATGKDGKYSGDLDMSRAKESGDLEFDADTVLTLRPDTTAQPSFTSDTLILKLAKNRHGEAGSITLERDKHTLACTEVDRTGSSVTQSYSDTIRAGWKS